MESQFLLVVARTVVANSMDFSMSRSGEIGGVVQTNFTHSWIVNSFHPLILELLDQEGDRIQCGEFLGRERLSEFERENVWR
jgi:hypothetical protein